MTTTTIIAGAGAQPVEVYARDYSGRLVVPTSATAAIVDLFYPDSAEASLRILSAESSATIDSTSATTSETAGPSAVDPRKIAVTSMPSGLTVGRYYQIAGAGQSEAFELDAVDVSGLALFAREPIRARYASGASVLGLRVSAVFPGARADLASELDRETIYGVDWTFTGIAGPSSIRTFAKIERRHRPPRASELDLLRIDPQLARSTHSRTVLRDHLQQADLELDARLLLRDANLVLVDEGLVGKLACAYRALELAYRLLGREFEGRAMWAATQAEDWCAKLLDGYRAGDVVATTRSGDEAVGVARRSAWRKA